LLMLLVQWLRLLDAGMCQSLWDLWWKKKLVLGPTFLRVLQLSPVSIIPPMLLPHSFIYHRRYGIILVTYSTVK
jgi:hypothetical protein